MHKKTIDYALRATWQAVAKMYNEEATKFDSTMSAGFTLLSIDPENGTPSTSLGPKMGMEATSLSRILKSMEEKGFIERKPNPEDGRSVFICLTELGAEKRNLARKVVLEFNEDVQQKIGKENLNLFFEITEKINDLILQKRKSTSPILSKTT